MSFLALLVPPAVDSSGPVGRVVLVGGVPGAGKTTAMARVAGERPAVDALDPEAVRDGLRRVLPEHTDYAVYRPLVHTVHALRVLLVLLAGPATGRTLLVHDPATRPRRRRWFARLARLRGWDPVLVYVDVPRALAETGQVLRGRVVDPVRFAGHWARWQALRAEMTGAPEELDGALWSDVVVTDRARVAADLYSLVAAAPLGQDEDSPNLSQMKESWDGCRTIDVPAGRDAGPHPVVQRHPRPAGTATATAPPRHA